MIDFEHLEKYRENNRIEAKKALGGLPHSIWETYSSFANTIGGILLLGVTELPDKTFQTVNLPDPEGMIRQFLSIVNDPQRVSVNILSEKDLAVHEIHGDRIIAITVPRADRRVKPVYIGTDPYTGAYRRDGEGDYHCGAEEVRMMLRDREGRIRDGRTLTDFGPDAFDAETVRRYLTCLFDCHPDWEQDGRSTEELLVSVGACGKGEDGGLHPTAAGLLLLGFEDEIVREFPSFFLDYQERDWDGSLEMRAVSSSGRWSGNLFDFYLRICGRIVKGLPADIHRPVREAVANCMINGDYYGSSGLVIVKAKDLLSVTNPGSFHIDIADAINGGKSEPRNETLSGLLHLVRVGTRTGRGVPDIYAVWKKKGFLPPRIQERFRPERITLQLPLEKERITGETPAGTAAEQIPERVGVTGDMESYVNRREYREACLRRQQDRERLIEYVTRNIHIDAHTAASVIGREAFSIDEAEAKRLLTEMEREGILTAEGGKKKIWSLKVEN